MSRLYFLVPSPGLAEQIVEALKREGADERDIGMLAGESAMTEGLPDADISETSDVKPALKQGAAVGGATGLLAGLAATIVPGGFAVGGAALLGMALAGSAFGAWTSSLIGVSVPNREVEAFRRAIDDGALLMIVDPSRISAERIKAIVSDRYPQVVYGGEQGEVQSVA